MKPRKKRRQKAVLDRIEDGRWAVLLIGRNEVEKIIPVDHLPEGTKPGTWLKVRVEDDHVHDIIVDEEETQVARGRIESKLEMLRNRQRRLQPISASEIQDENNRLQNKPPSQDEG